MNQLILSILIVALFTGITLVVLTYNNSKDTDVTAQRAQSTLEDPTTSTVDGEPCVLGKLYIITENPAGVYQYTSEGLALRKLLASYPDTTQFIVLQGTYQGMYVMSDGVFQLIASSTASSGDLVVEGDLKVTGNIEGTLSATSQSKITKLGTLTENLDMGENQVVGSSNPTSSYDLATKEYVDNYVNGNVWRDNVSTITTDDLGATYDNGVSGVGATLTKAEVLGNISGFASWVVGTTRVLVPAQTDRAENGVYVVTQVTNPWILTRAIDFDGDPAYECKVGTGVYVSSGIYGGNRYIIGTKKVDLPSYPTLKVGVEPMDWIQQSGPANTPLTCIVRYRVGPGVGGGSQNAATWDTRPLNEVSDFGGLGITLASNVMTVPAGTYFITGYAESWGGVLRSECRLWNVTSNSILEDGSNIAYNGDGTTICETQVTFNDSTEIRFESQCENARAGDGMGLASTVGDAVHTRVVFTRIT